MRGMITTIDVFLHAPGIVRLFGWKVLVRAFWRICTKKGGCTFLECIL